MQPGCRRETIIAATGRRAGVAEALLVKERGEAMVRSTIKVNDERERFLRLARSKYQRESLVSFWDGEELRSPRYYLTGTSKMYSNAYQRAWEGLLQRIRDAGYHVIVTPGPRGGMNSAKYAVRREEGEE